MRAKCRLIILSILLSINGAFANINDKELQGKLLELDAILEVRDVFIKQKEERIDALKRLLQSDGLQDDYIYNINSQIVDEYRTYQFDSTIYYLNKNINLAQGMRSEERSYDSYLRLAYSYTTSGLYLEASDILASKIDTTQLSKDLLVKYYITQRKLLDELSLYSIDRDIVQRAEDERKYYINRIVELGDDTSTEYNEIIISCAIARNDYDYAYDYASQIIEKYECDEHRYAVMAYLLGLISGLRGDDDSMIYWYIESASTDITLAVRDNTSLSLLADNIFSNNNDVGRSMNYMRVVMEDSKFFNSKLRPISSSKVMVDIESAYLEREAKINKLYLMLLSLALVFVILLIFVVIYINRHRMQLTLARKRTEGAYEQLSKSSDMLKRTNGELRALNSKIVESDRVKEEYIAIFFMKCSEYIDQIENNHRHVRKCLRDGKITELKQEYHDVYNSSIEMEKFYNLFDSTFLNLYPTFVEEFNSLLTEESQITPRKGESLTVELRIYALVRLGITDPAKISAMLRYSMNTIYNYRSRVRNHANCDKSEFDIKVKTICSIGED
ncbi:MAG: DUF6377 domain-containing protein [Rikenellaceae bacterium]